MFPETWASALMRSVGSEGGSVWECSSIAGDPFLAKAQGKKGARIIVECGPVVQMRHHRGAIQSDALTLRIFVIRLVGSDLRASRFCRTWPNRPPNRRFYG